MRLPTVLGDNPRKNSFLNLLKKMVKDNSPISRFDWPGKVGLIDLPDLCKYLVSISDKAPKKPKIVSICGQNMTLAQILEQVTTSQGKKYEQIKLPGFVWNTARFLRPYLVHFENILPSGFYNLFWRASIVVDSPLWCKEKK